MSDDNFVEDFLKNAKQDEDTNKNGILDATPEEIKEMGTALGVALSNFFNGLMSGFSSSQEKQETKEETTEESKPELLNE